MCYFNFCSTVNFYFPLCLSNPSTVQVLLEKIFYGCLEKLQAALNQALKSLLIKFRLIMNSSCRLCKCTIGCNVKNEFSIDETTTPVCSLKNVLCTIMLFGKELNYKIKLCPFLNKMLLQFKKNVLKSCFLQLFHLLSNYCHCKKGRALTKTTFLLKMLFLLRLLFFLP